MRTVVALLALLAIARAEEWQTIRNCRLIENESNRERKGPAGPAGMRNALQLQKLVGEAKVA